ncbi:MAG: Hsp33 family molecular chaperone HslO, partial [Pseudomonadota bacterium]|nr:Hsp33 family molecular chaperone HslO [Pseudomonadota bacterium]
MMATDEIAGFAAEQPGSDDRALPFQVEGLDVRGRVVTLGPSLDAILQRHDFPAPVKRLVG